MYLPSKRDRVEEVLSEFPDTRDDNRHLLFRFWEREGLVLTPEQWAMVPTLTQPETIRRTRADIQNVEGKYPKSE